MGFLFSIAYKRRETKRQALEKDRGIREARRKYRENIVAPVIGALNEVQSNPAFSEYVSTICEAEKQGVSLKAEVKGDLATLQELQHRGEVRNMRKALTELVPLAAPITDEETRKFVQQALVSAGFTKETRELLKMTEGYTEQKLKVAYQKLEDYVALAD